MNSLLALINPIGHKNISITGAAIIAVATEYNFFPVIAEHWERVKTLITANLFNL